MSERNSSWGITAYFRGFAIASIMINHYLNVYVKGDFSGFGNATITIFFILSGYGIYFSLERRFDDQTYSAPFPKLFP